MNKNIHLRTSATKLHICWLRSSKHSSNIFKIFENSEQGLKEMLQWLLIGYEGQEKNIYIDMASTKDNHKLLSNKLRKSNINISINNAIKNPKLNVYICTLSKKIKFMKTVLLTYKNKMLTKTKTSSLQKSIDVLEMQLQHDQNKYKNYLTWASL